MDEHSIQPYVEQTVLNAHRFFVPQSRHLAIDEFQRTALVDWLRDICDTYELSDDTLSGSVWVMDCFFRQRQPPIGKLQLYACSSLLIASKYEDGLHPAVSELVFLCDGLYEAKDILDAEINILNVLNFGVMRTDVRYIARALLIGSVVDTDYLEAVDYIATSSLWSSEFTNQNPFDAANVLLDTIETGLTVPVDYPQKELRRQLINAVSLRSSKTSIT